MDPSAVVLRIGSRSVTRAEFELLALGMRVDVSQDSPDSRRDLGQRIGGVLALAEEARRRKVDQDPKVDGRLRAMHEQLLASLLFDYIVADVHKDEASVRRYFETHPSVAEHRKIRHILIRFSGPNDAVKYGRTEAAALERAKALRSRLLAGTDFTALAKAESDDEKTANNGGDLGTNTRGVFLPDFEIAAFRLAAGELSEPVKTHDGYHLILVERIIPPKFEEVRKSIEYQIARELTEAISKTIELNEQYFGKRK